MSGSDDKQEKISMVRSIIVGFASFAFTVVLIAGSGMQGSGLIG